MPDLEFRVESAAALPFSAVPALALQLRITNRDPQPVRSMSLTTQVRIVATQRQYSATEQERLLDVFGEPSRWGQTLKSLLWTVSTIHVPGFREETIVDLPVPCTFDLEVVSAKYFQALDEGGREIPLELLFSGSIFFSGESGLQVEQISWDKETRFAMPVSVWKDVIRLYFPNSAWLRLHKQTFERLQQYRARNVLPTWDAALEHLLQASEQQEPSWTR